MIDVDIPGHKKLSLKYLVLDYNGTLAVDGMVLEGVKERLTTLAEKLEVHVLTADTFGKVRSGMNGVPCNVSILPPGDQEKGKLEYIRRLGCEHVAAGGNGRNDRLMLKEAALGIALILGEGSAVETLLSADVVFTDIRGALDFLNHPLRMTATLRS